jgi:glycosyltransferase involved in cell wall biosynthesis
MGVDKDTMKIKRILIVSTVGLIYDGITSVILSNLQAMDRTGLEIYIASTIKAEPCIVDQFKALGCMIVDFPNRRENPKAYFFALRKFIKDKNIEAIHANGNSATLAVEMLAAKLGGCKKRIAHSHNTRCDQVRADKMLRPLFYTTYTDALACGEDAGKWLFQNRPFTVVKNGRDVDRFKFDDTKRKEMRKKLGINDSLAVGHVGGFVPQKNHDFLLQIYKSLAEKEPTVKLFMIGDGILRREIETEAQELGLMEKLTFTGNIDNVPDYLNAMDGMIFPSLFEGLPLAAIEWQINGLPIVMADTITKECVFTDKLKQLSLNNTPGKWADTIIEMIRKNNREQQSRDGIKAINRAGYNIKDTAKLLREIYLG